MRDWLYVEDHARALDVDRERGRPGETYNVGGRNERRNIDVVRRICDDVDELRAERRARTSASSPSSPTGPGTISAMRSTPPSSRRELGWHAQETFESGIEKTVRWYLDNEWRWRPLRERCTRASVSA